MLRKDLLTLAPAIAFLAALTPLALAQTSQNTPSGDVYVAGSLCLSDDHACTPGGFIPDGLELQLRDSIPGIYFDETDNVAGNNNDFAIQVNTNKLVVRDRGVNSSVLTEMVVIEAGAPANSIRIDSSGAIGFGTSTPAEELHVIRSDNSNTIIRAENTNAAGVSSASAIQSKADVAQVSFQSHGSGRTISRFGKTLGGWNEMLGVFGNGFIIGTLFDKPLIFGTNGQNRLEITPGGDVVHFSAGKVHPDFVFEPGYKLESIEQHAEAMWRKKYLPAVGAGEYAADGRAMFKLGAGRVGILEELEKAHIYIEQLQEEVEQKDERIAALEKNVAEATKTLQDVVGRVAALEAR